jgi:hypothetical protein
VHFNNAHAMCHVSRQHVTRSYNDIKIEDLTDSIVDEFHTVLV